MTTLPLTNAIRDIEAATKERRENPLKSNIAVISVSVELLVEIVEHGKQVSSAWEVYNNLVFCNGFQLVGFTEMGGRSWGILSP